MTQKAQLTQGPQWQHKPLLAHHKGENKTTEDRRLKSAGASCDREGFMGAPVKSAKLSTFVAG
jgi:hypothetical protein